MKPLFCLLLALYSCAAAAVDMESGVKNLRRHSTWMSMEFRDPNFGRFLAARASSNDPRKDINFNITYSLQTEGCREVIEVVVKLNEPASTSLDREMFIELQVDDRVPKTVSVRAVAAEHDEFLYMQIKDTVTITELLGKRSLMVNTRRLGVAEYQFKGMADAIRAAKESCNANVAR